MPVRRVPRPTPLFAVALAAAVAAGPGAAPEAPQQAPVFRAGVDLIQVDVSVLDRDRRPVRGLGADDFVILENGQPQAVAAFAAVDVPEPEAPPATWMREVVPDVRTNQLGDGRLFALVLDDATLPPDPRIVSTARTIARNIVERLGPADLASVVFTRDNRHAVDFTSDRARLLAAIGRFTPGFTYSTSRRLDDHYYFFSSINVLGQVSSYLSSVPQRRKAIIYISTGVPVDTETAAQAIAIGAGVGSLDELNLAQDLLSRTQETFATALQHTFLRAQHGNVNIYAIDPGGLGGLQAFLSRRAGMDAYLEARLNQEFLQTVAENSGGRAIVNTNNPEQGVAQIFRENSSYYLLGYVSPRPRDDRRVRRVEVRVKQPGLTTRTRSAYFETRNAPSGAEVAPALQLTNALAGILPNPDITMRAAAAPFRIAGQNRAAVAIVLGVRHALPPAAPGPLNETMELLVAAFTPDGDPRGSLRQTARLTFRAGTTEEARYEFRTRMELAPGRYQLRLAATSTLLEKSGSVYYEVDVPDFEREALSLSGLAVGVTPAVPSAGSLDTLLPVAPTSQREFAPTDQVRVFLQAYQGGTGRLWPASIAVKVTDERSTVVYRATDAIAPDQFANRRTLDYGFELPVDRLAPGRHLLTVEVERGGRTARRDLMFTVRAAAR